MTQTNGDGAEVVEHRLALVMNGGVSLAVWMGGVACEIDNARRASNGLPVPAGATAAQQKVHELWAAAMGRAGEAHTGAKLTVDVIAGTSAGGLNGILLAAAAARGASLSGLRKLWLEAGQLSATALLRPQPEPQSLLDGEYFHQKIVEALDNMTAQPEPERRDVSLIVTATGLGQSARPVVDSNKHPFSEPDHRRQFHFSRHPARAVYQADGDNYKLGLGTEVNHFETSEPLATAARATASFPVAFKPQLESVELRHRRVFPDWQTGSRLEWLADGGMLDNSPFEPVLRSIQHKPVSGSWRRTLCYVDPSAAEVATTGHSPVETDPGPPPSWLSVAGSAMSLPREIDFRDGIDELHRTIRSGRSSLDVRRFQSLAGEPGWPALLDIARGICSSAIALYRDSSAVAAIYDVRELAAKRDPNGYLTPAAVLDPKVLPVTGERSWLPTSFPTGLPASWDWGAAAAVRVLRTMLRSTNNAKVAAADRGQISLALERAIAVERAVNEQMAAAARGSDVTDLDILGLLDDTYHRLNVADQLASIVADGATACATAVAVTAAADTPKPAASDVLAAALAVEVSNGSGSVSGHQPRPLFDFDRLGLDAPPALLRDAYEAALQPTERTPSPSAGNVLYGSRLNHFAAFGQPDWRRWDWLWGRLNALQHLAQLLTLQDDDVDQLTRAIIEDEGADAPPDEPRDLGWVCRNIATVVRMDASSMIEVMRDSNELAEGIDALLALARSEPLTNPPLPQRLVWAGQYLSAILARDGHVGPLDFIHRLVREGMDRLTPIQQAFWRRFEPGD